MLRTRTDISSSLDLAAWCLRQEPLLPQFCPGLGNHHLHDIHGSLSRTRLHLQGTLVNHLQENPGKDERRAYVVLVLISVILSFFCIMFCVRLVNQSDHKWCDIVNTLVLTPVPKPTDGNAHPSRVRAYEYYKKFLELDKSLGCK